VADCDDDCDECRAAGRTCWGSGGGRASTRNTASHVATSQGHWTVMYGRHHWLLGLRRRATSQGTTESHRYVGYIPTVSWTKATSALSWDRVPTLNDKTHIVVPLLNTTKQLRIHCMLHEAPPPHIVMTISVFCLSVCLFICHRHRQFLWHFPLPPKWKIHFCLASSLWEKITKFRELIWYCVNVYLNDKYRQLLMKLWNKIINVIWRSARNGHRAPLQ